MPVKSLTKKHRPHVDLLAPGEDPFSTNKVTGYSLNVPIIGTCSPTQVCADTCYYARGATTWRQSLDKQHRLMNSIKADPIDTGDRIVRFAMRKRLTFIRWNGGGDLFEEMLPCIDRVATKVPDVPQWIVSRLPGLASRVAPRDNVYLHFSVDKSSWARLDEMRRLTRGSLLQWFWSYQCDKGETMPSPDVAPVIFRHNYDLAGDTAVANDCPLNTSDCIVRICETCRRCFNGEAVARSENRWIK
jgi:hypothetical protein